MKKKIFYSMVFGVLLIFLGQFFYFTKTIEKVCAQIDGINGEDLKRIVDEYNLRFSGDYSSGGIVHATKNFGRGVCVVKLEKGVVKEAIFDIRD